ncbi:MULTISPECIES: ParA family protein [Corynebacterium]|uniref:ParA family protein n=1 Tax=Corynebacterium TaxID=1716 RepID=UPI002260EF80|nr:ParA family protein [Corynebacterium marambiense]MCX7543597.1 ParA family protein [Corynebacterium marambiense]
MLWGVVHTKGGVGKTTTSLYLALAAHRRGVPVRLVDADPQASATMWASAAVRAGDPLPFAVEPYSGAPRAKSGELILIDTPPGQADVLQEVLDCVDVAIVPTAASPMDLERVWPTLEVTSHLPTVVLLTQINTRARLVAELRELFEEQGVPVAENFIRHKEAFKQAWGTTPADLAGYGEVYDEISEALKWH